MTAALRQRWQARSPRERQVWRAALALAAVATYLALVVAALQAREPLHQQVEALRGESARMDQQARELEQLRRQPATAMTGEPLRERVQSVLDATPVAGSPARLEAPDPEHVVVVFEAVAFADWLRWLEALAARQVRLESCRIDALPASGQVGITATLVRAGAP